MGILDFFDSLPKRGDVSPEELAARREAYRQAYQDSFLARNRDSKPSSVQALEDYGEYLPLYGDATAFMEAGGLLSEGNRKAAALVAAGGLLGVVPGAGDIAARPFIAAGRKAADIANRIEIDPSMVGSMGGNLKVRPKENTIKVYHGGPEQITSPRMMADPEGQPKGFSVTPQKEVAEFYKRLRGGGHVSEFSIDKNKYNPISEYDLYALIDDTEIRLGLDEGELTNDQISQMLSDRGINAISYANPDFGIRILSEDILTPASKGLLQSSEAKQSAPSLPAPRNEAEAMAQKVLEMRAAGNAGDVTEEMMALADDQYMYFNTPIDMSVDARAQRSEDMGFGKDLFHGGKGGYSYLSADDGTGKTLGTGAFLSPSNLLAETYSPVVDGAVYPVSSRSSAPIVSADMQNWNNIESPVYAYDPNTMEDIEIISDYGRASTDDIARNARGMAEAVEIQDVSDRGPRAWGLTQYPATSTVRVEYDPRNLRSRFARFDPEFRHLRNLSAGVGGLGLLSTIPSQEDQY